MENTIDDQESYERRDTVIFAGDTIPIATTGEKCANIVINLVKEKLGIEMPVNEMNTACSSLR